MMQRTRLEAAVILGIVIPQIFSISMSFPPSDCLAAVDTCMSNLCKSERAFHDGICEDEGCHIKSSEVCNLTIQTVLDQFPSLQGCVCAWKEELCDSIEALATQCHQKPAAQQKTSTVMDWQSSSLIGFVYGGAVSCLDQMKVCVRDAVCNRYLARVLQACMGEQCNTDRCRQVTHQFYGSMRSVAEMLVMCKCEASDQSCLQMKTALHSGTCGGETWNCLDTVSQCVRDSNCKEQLKTFRTKCWSSEEAQCSDSELLNDECFTQMDPALMLGADPECKTAFLATLGTVLHYPCTCSGAHNDDLLTCNVIHDVFHNRSRFMTSWKSSNSGTSKPPEINDGHTWSHGKFPHMFNLTGNAKLLDYRLYAFATVLLVVILMPLAVVCTIWVLRRRDKTKFHHPRKSNSVVIA